MFSKAEIPVLCPAGRIIYYVGPNIQIILFIANDVFMEGSLPDILPYFPINQPLYSSHKPGEGRRRGPWPGPYGDRAKRAASFLRAESDEICTFFAVVILLQARRLANWIVCPHRSSQRQAARAATAPSAAAVVSCRTLFLRQSPATKRPSVGVRQSSPESA